MLEQLTGKYDLHNKVVLHGFQKRSYIGRQDEKVLFCTSVTTETFGVSMLKQWLAGLLLLLVVVDQRVL